MVDAAKPAAKPNSGYLYPNKKTSDKQPDYKGKLNDANGKEWLISAWKRMKDGEEMLSIALTDPASLPPRPAGSSTGTPASTSAPSSNVRSSTPATPAPTTKVGGAPLQEIDPQFGDLFDTL